MRRDDWGELIPRLVARYGGDAMTWLDRTPRAIVRACLLMLPRLQAEESLLTSQRIAVGTGSMKSADSRQITSGWIRAMRNQGTSMAPGPSSKASIRAFCANGGMGYVRTPKPSRVDTQP